MKICVFGLGYVGAVTTACLADLGHQVRGIDVDPHKVELLRGGQAPVSEPGLAELIADGVAVERISATTDVNEALLDADIAMICVGTPSTATGGIDDRHVVAVMEQICAALRGPLCSQTLAIVVRSTCLPNTHRRLQEIIQRDLRDAEERRVHYICHPEFLREGTALADFYAPPKIVFGVSSSDAEMACREIYHGIDAETFVVPIGVASMIKYADNCFHATKVTFANEMAQLCRALDVDPHQVMDVFCQDTKLNISTKYLSPGAPFGGSCLPKDLRALLDTARQTATTTPLLAGVDESNHRQVAAVVDRIAASLERRVGIVGLTFKPDTDDLRESPAVAIAEQLLGKGFELRLFDRYLAVSRLVGRNRSYALRAIPHLSKLLLDDLSAVIADSDRVLVFHPVETDTLEEEQRTELLEKAIDFTNSLKGAAGVYWDRTREPVPPAVEVIREQHTAAEAIDSETGGSQTARHDRQTPLPLDD